HQLRGAVRVSTQRAKDRPVHTRFLQGLLDRRRQDLVRTDLDERAAVAGQTRDHRCKDHGVAQVLVPVLRVESGTVHSYELRYGPRRPFGGGRHRGVEGDITRTRSDPGKDLQEPIPNPVDGKGVRTVVETEVTHPYTVLFARGDELRDRVAVTGDDRCVRSVH